MSARIHRFTLDYQGVQSELLTAIRPSRNHYRLASCPRRQLCPLILSRRTSSACVKGHYCARSQRRKWIIFLDCSFLIIYGARVRRCLANIIDLPLETFRNGCPEYGRCPCIIAPDRLHFARPSAPIALFCQFSGHLKAPQIALSFGYGFPFLHSEIAGACVWMNCIRAENPCAPSSTPSWARG